MQQSEPFEDLLLRSQMPASDVLRRQKAETVLERLPPVLTRHFESARHTNTCAGHDELLDLALTRAIMELRFALNQQTFEYLHWRVERLAVQGLALSPSKQVGSP